MKHTYGQILKSSALIGGSSVINIGIGIIRTKAMAILLGPSGVGLMGLYSSIMELTQSVVGMGANSSGVRQIAAAVGSKDTQRIARTAIVLRRVSAVLGILGAVLLIGGSRFVSELTFGNEHQAGAIALLSVAVIFRLVSGGQGALIQGMRRIPDLAWLGVLGALAGTVAGIPLVYLFRENGVVPALVAAAGASLLASWWFSRKVKIESVPMTFAQHKLEAASLLKLGFAFMVTGMLTMVAAYVIRTIVIRKMGMEAAGLYQSAWALGGLYVGFIFEAMGSDFYPRLTAVAHDNAECNRLVNEQALVGLLLAGPGVIGTIALAPLVISMFYSVSFVGAVPPLRWLCLGLILRVMAWPVGFILLAKNKQKLIVGTELAACVLHVGLAWLCVGSFGLTGAGIAFFGLYVWHGLFIYVIARRLSGFRWSIACQRTGILFLSLTATVFCCLYVLSSWWATAFGISVALLSGFYSIRKLLSLFSTPQGNRGNTMFGMVRDIYRKLGSRQ